MNTLTMLNSHKELKQELTTIRRDIHQHPETAFVEVRTADIVAEYLQKWGLKIHRGLAETGVVGTLKRGASEKTIGLRADMDALFIQEENTLPYKSVHDGVMHACGHDGHTAMLLGAARYFSEHDEFDGTIHFIFQPAEENEGGARVMMEQGLFEKFPCDAVYALHNMPGFELGTFAIRSGSFMASSDTWSVTFRGSGGHGSQPHLCTDATVAAAHFITALQTVVSRNVHSIEPGVISVGYISGGSANAPNIIPAEVVVKGTARSFSPPIRDLIERRMGEIADSVAKTFQLDADYHYLRRYPPLVNHAAQTETAIKAAEKLVAKSCVLADVEPFCGAEDFAFMLEKVPGAYIFIGNGMGKPKQHLHAPCYDFNDDLIVYGVAYWIELIKAELPLQEA